MDDPYEVLGIAKDSDITKIRKAYKNLAMKLHPDKIGNNHKALEQMKLVNEAYAILSNKKVRLILEEDSDWEGTASSEVKEKVWEEYSKQVEQYYEQVQSYLETELSSIQKERVKLSSIEQRLVKRENDLQKKEMDMEVKIRKREDFIAKREAELDELLVLISRSNSLAVDLVQTSKSLRSRK